jgi:hypothetical protein
MVMQDEIMGFAKEEKVYDAQRRQGFRAAH